MANGHCAICDTNGKLTDDHVPPQACPVPSRVVVNRLVDYMGGERERGKRSQSGVSRGSLCADCNNTRLGAGYDPEIVRVTAKVTSALSASAGLHLSLPDPFPVATKPQRLARSIVGHLLAMVPEGEEGSPARTAPMPLAMRDYFMDPSAPLPNDLSIYYWTYPARAVVIARSVGKLILGSRQTVVGDILKFYPLGYWVVWGAPPLALPSGVRPLLTNRALGLDDEVDLLIGLSLQPPVDFPEAPDEYGVTLMGGDEAIVAHQKLTKRQRR